MMKKMISVLLSIIILSSLGITVSAEEENLNPYIQAYENELKRNKKATIAEDNLVVDESVEDEIIRDALNEFYQLDLMVLEILKDVFPSNAIETKVLSSGREDKVEIMHMIIQKYDDITDKKDKDILIQFLKNYMQGKDGIDSQVEDFLLLIEIPERNARTTYRTYNYNAAGTWAYNNYSQYNRNYPEFTGSFGSDCTNFVSQAMHMGGGLPQFNNWYCTKKNNTYWVINSANQLNTSFSLSDPSPWISVKQFHDFWRKRATYYTFGKEYYKNNHQDVFNKNIYKGDIVLLRKFVGFVSIPTHAMIISSYDHNTKDFKLAGHSNNRQAHPLLTAISDYSSINIITPRSVPVS